MATAEILSKQLTGTTARVQVRLTDGTDTIEREYVADNMTDEWLQARIRQDVANFVAIKSFVEGLPLGSFSFSVTAPTPEEQALDDWCDDLAKLRAGLRLVEAGVLAADYQPILNIRTSLTSGFLPVYLDDPRV